MIETEGGSSQFLLLSKFIMVMPKYTLIIISQATDGHRFSPKNATTNSVNQPPSTDFLESSMDYGLVVVQLTVLTKKFCLPKYNSLTGKLTLTFFF